MELIADILLISGAIAATVYCIVLSRRLRKFTDLEQGIGGAIAVLSVQVDDMTKTLSVAQNSAVGSAESLSQLTIKAENAARKLELLCASLHDLPEPRKQTDEMPDGTSVQPEQTPASEIEEAPEQQPLFLSKRNQIHEAAE